MPPKKRQRNSTTTATASAASTPRSDARPKTPITSTHPSQAGPRPITSSSSEQQGLAVAADLWTDDQELALLSSIIKHKPTGIHKHFRMLSIYSSLHPGFPTTAPIPQTAQHTRPGGIWDKLAEMYDLEALDARELEGWKEGVDREGERVRAVARWREEQREQEVYYDSYSACEADFLTNRSAPTSPSASVASISHHSTSSSRPAPYHFYPDAPAPNEFALPSSPDFAQLIWERRFRSSSSAVGGDNDSATADADAQHSLGSSPPLQPSLLARRDDMPPLSWRAYDRQRTLNAKQSASADRDSRRSSTAGTDSVVETAAKGTAAAAASKGARGSEAETPRGGRGGRRGGGASVRGRGGRGATGRQSLRSSGRGHTASVSASVSASASASGDGEEEEEDEEDEEAEEEAEDEEVEEEAEAEEADEEEAEEADEEEAEEKAETTSKSARKRKRTHASMSSAAAAKGSSTSTPSKRGGRASMGTIKGSRGGKATPVAKETGTPKTVTRRQVGGGGAAGAGSAKAEKEKEKGGRRKSSRRTG